MATRSVRGEIIVEEVQQEIDRWQLAHAADPRLTLCRVRAEGGQGGLVLAGEVLHASTRVALMACLSERFPAERFENRVAALLDEAPAAAVHRAVANVRREPTERSELLTQALFNEEVAVLREKDGWGLVRLEADGYLGWMPLHALAGGAPPQPTHRVRAFLAAAFAGPDSEETAGQLPFGVPVSVLKEHGARAAIAVPGGGAWWIARADLVPVAPAAHASGVPAALEEALRLAGRFVGVPYLWGGRSPFGFDCSGLAQTILRFAGLPAPRDADMQFGCGEEVNGAAAPGDLLFFGRPGYTAAGIARHGGVNHVVISTGGGEFLHASSAIWGAAYGSLDASSPRCYPDLAAAFLGARRYSP